MTSYIGMPIPFINIHSYYDIHNVKYHKHEFHVWLTQHKVTPKSYTIACSKELIETEGQNSNSEVFINQQVIWAEVTDIEAVYLQLIRNELLITKKIMYKFD